MENFYIQYLFKILLSSTIFYLAYLLFLKKDTCFTLKRIYLILATIVPVVYPFVSFSLPTQSVENNITLQAIVVTNSNIQSLLHENVNTLSQYHIKDFVIGLWVIGAFVALLLLGIKLYQISKLYRSSMFLKQYKVGKCTVYETRSSESFSFFNTIFIGSEGGNKNEILQHELIHVKYKHSLELIYLEIITILFWLNPVYRLIKQEVKINHEYMVDQEMIDEGVNKKEYQYMLLHETIKNSSISIINYFNVLQLKKRISMMNKERTNKIGYAKYLVMILIPIMLFVTNSKTLSAKNILVSEILPETEITTPENLSPSEDGKVYDFVEVMPKFPGGQSAMMRFIADNLIYPEEAVKQEKEGRVTLKFVITETGEIKDVKIVRGVDPLLDQTAIDVIKKMPKWTPGQQGGKDVAVNYNIPIVFSLNGSSKAAKPSEKDGENTTVVTGYL